MSCRTVSYRAGPWPHQFQQLLKPEKEPLPATAPESTEIAAKDGGFESISTRVSPAGEGVREGKEGAEQKAWDLEATIPFQGSVAHGGGVFFDT